MKWLSLYNNDSQIFFSTSNNSHMICLLQAQWKQHDPQIELSPLLKIFFLNSVYYKTSPYKLQIVKFNSSLSLTPTEAASVKWGFHDHGYLRYPTQSLLRPFSHSSAKEQPKHYWNCTGTTCFQGPWLFLSFCHISQYLAIAEVLRNDKVNITKLHMHFPFPLVHTWSFNIYFPKSTFFRTLTFIDIVAKIFTIFIKRIK